MLALKRQGTRGFTLLELLITMAVVAILAAIAVPSFQNMIATQQVRSAASDLVSALNFARSEAVKRNAEVRIAQVGTWAGGWSITVGGTPLRNHDGFDGVTATGHADGNGEIIFIGDGRRGDTQNESITIAPPAGSGVSPICVRVGSTGKASIATGACP